LDAVGALHHVMARGIEGCDIFRDDSDRDEFVRRLAVVVERTGLEIHAWTLMPNHFHLLARTKIAPLERAMRALLTGHAIYFNRRHQRVGHLFQNRYKSIVCDHDSYFLELVRYIHLNPLRGGVVPSLEALDSYPYSGHATLLGRYRRPWQVTELVLRALGNDAVSSAAAYRCFVSKAASQGRRADLVGGGLVRSAGGWAAVKELRRGRERFASDERVLGDTNFVERLLAELGNPEQFDRAIILDRVVDAVCRRIGMPVAQLPGRSRTADVLRARRAVAYLWLYKCGGQSSELVALLGLSRFSIHRAAHAGRADSQWAELILDELKAPDATR